MKRKKLFKFAIAFVVLVVVTLMATDYWVKSATQNLLYTDVQKVPHNKVGLLLGTSKLLKDGRINLYYKFRIDAAVALFKAGKIDFILVSGDNGHEEYDETTAMQTDLIAAGIPADKIFMDYAGFRTLDSILRAKEVFGQSSITVISQPFHNERAIFIANNKDMTAIAFNAEDVHINSGFKTQLREKFARVKMLLDLAFNKQAKFYGDKIEIK